MNGFTEIRLLSAQQQTLHAPAGLGRWGLFWHRWTTRQQLRALSAQELADVGLTVQQQRMEGVKPFWRS